LSVVLLQVWAHAWHDASLLARRLSTLPHASYTLALHRERANGVVESHHGDEEGEDADDVDEDADGKLHPLVL